MQVITPNRQRYLLIALVFATYAWMSIEDNTPLTPVLLGTAWAGFWVLRVIARHWQAGRYPRWQVMTVLALGGALWGGGASLLSALLMLFKNAWHDHPFPDFPPPLLLEILLRAPVWALAGALVVFGAGCVVLAMISAPPRRKS